LAQPIAHRGDGDPQRAERTQQQRGVDHLTTLIEALIENSVQRLTFNAGGDEGGEIAGPSLSSRVGRRSPRTGPISDRRCATSARPL